MKKKYYSQLKIDKKGSIDTFKTYASNVWNPAQKENGKWKIGALRLRDTHMEVFISLFMLTIKKTLARKNKLNAFSEKISPFNIEKPIELKARPYEIRAMLLGGLKDGVSLQTVKNRMDRLEDAGIITRRWLRAEEVFLICLYPQFLALKCGETDNFIKTNEFSKSTKPINCKTKNENLKDITNPYTNNNDKIIQDELVDKRNLHSQMNLSKKQGHLKKQGQNSATINTSNNNFPEPKGNSNFASSGKDVARERTTHKPNSEEQKLLSYKKKIANQFYEKLILTLWSHVSHYYLPKLAPTEHLHYIQQSIETLMHDQFYFGACKTEAEINYQLKKMLKALNSTNNWLKKKQTRKSDFRLDFLFPNVFLRNEHKQGMSFKSSMIEMEAFMRMHDEMELLHEKKMQKERDKATKTRFNHIVSQIIAYILLNSKVNTQKLLYQAGEYLREIHPELCMKLYTDWSNPYLVKQILAKHKETGYDYAIINECFTIQAQIEQDILKLLPKMQKLLQKDELTIGQQMLIRFNIRGAEKKPVPKAYDKRTLKLLEYYVRVH
jgi:hypothetical protein